MTAISIALKGKNKKVFIDTLSNNIKQSLNDMKELVFEKQYDRFYIHLDMFSDIDEILFRIGDLIEISIEDWEALGITSNYLQTEEGKNLPVKHCIKGTVGHELFGITKSKMTKKDRIIEKEEVVGVGFGTPG